MTDLMTLQTIFKERLLQIPGYQRGYDWEENQRKDLLDDLESIPDGKHHYTGTIVVHDTQAVKNIFGENYKVLDVVDGQQRLTTLILLINEIRKSLLSISGELDQASRFANTIQSTYIKVDSQLGDFCKLTLQGDVQPIFKSILTSDAQPIIDDISLKSHKNLMNASKEFSAYLRRIKNSMQDDSEYFRWLQSILERITSRIRFNFYEIEEEAEVGVIFEVMNDRGKPLSQLEKVKNYLMYVAYKTSSDHNATQVLVDLINLAWQTVFRNLMMANKTSSNEEDQLLRFHWNITQDQDSKNYDIHHSVKDKFNLRDLSLDECYNRIQEYVESLREFSVIYRDLSAPNGTFSFEYLDSRYSPLLRDIMIRIGRLGSQATVFPLMMAVVKRWTAKPEYINEIARLCEVYIFRVYEVVERKSNTGLSKITRLAYRVHNDSSYGAIDAVRNLKELINEYASDDDVRVSMNQLGYSYYEWDGLKFFLYEYEKYTVESIDGLLELSWKELQSRDKQETVEHILPQTLTTQWRENFSKDSHLANVHRLGNLTLTRWNGTLSNKSFQDKKGLEGDSASKSYRNSTIQIEKRIASFEEWTASQIDQRTNEMIEFALKRWGI